MSLFVPDESLVERARKFGPAQRMLGYQFAQECDVVAASVQARDVAEFAAP